MKSFNKNQGPNDPHHILKVLAFETLRFEEPQFSSETWPWSLIHAYRSGLDQR